MNEPHFPERQLVSDATMHLTDWTLEQLAEGMLPEAEQADARAHVDGCARCAAELAGYRMLYAALEELPRFAPSAGFSDAVLARVRTAPQPGPLWVWLQRWVPSTRRGWALVGAALTAPVAALIGLAVWLLGRPGASMGTLHHWVRMGLASVGDAALGIAVHLGVRSGLFGWVRTAYEAVREVPLETAGLLLAVLAVAIPLSAWSLIRLVRTPMGKATYAS